MFASLLCIKAFDLDTADFSGGRITLSGSTDNKGNSHVISKLMTTKFPLCAFLMEIAATIQIAEADIELGLVPRDQNTEADELSNFDSRNFSPELEVKLTSETTRFILLDEFLEEGERLYLEIEEQKEKARSTPPVVLQAAKKRKRKPDTRLRVTHPW